MKNKILTLYDQGMSYSDIAYQLGCSKSTISYHVTKHRRDALNQQPIYLQAVLEYLSTNTPETPTELARAIGCSLYTIQKYRERGYINVLFPKERKVTGNNTEVVCLGCGKNIRRNKSNLCFSCVADKRIDDWLSGILPGHKGKSASLKSFVRSWILDRDNHECTECGQGEIWNNKPLTLHVDHIDGNALHTKPSNLRTLCPHCHSQTKTFGSKNTGNGRRYYRELKRQNHGR